MISMNRKHRNRYAQVRIIIINDGLRSVLKIEFLIAQKFDRYWPAE